MTQTENFSKPDQQIQIDHFALSEYSTFLENAFAGLGMSRHEAIKAVIHQREHDAATFVIKAANLEAYRTRITEQPDGIPAEMYEFAIRKNPGQVLADASHWAAIQRQKEK